MCVHIYTCVLHVQTRAHICICTNRFICAILLKRVLWRFRTKQLRKVFSGFARLLAAAEHAHIQLYTCVHVQIYRERCFFELNLNCLVS